MPYNEIIRKKLKLKKLIVKYKSTKKYEIKKDLDNASHMSLYVIIN